MILGGAMSEESDEIRKFYCANCMNCKVLKGEASDGQKIQKVRCAAGHWKKKLGGEKYYNFASVLRRTQSGCPDYEATGEPKPLIKRLKKTMPTKDETYISD